MLENVKNIRFHEGSLSCTPVQTVVNYNFKIIT